MRCRCAIHAAPPALRSKRVHVPTHKSLQRQNIASPTHPINALQQLPTPLPFPEAAVRGCEETATLPLSFKAFATRIASSVASSRRGYSIHGGECTMVNEAGNVFWLPSVALSMPASGEPGWSRGPVKNRYSQNLCFSSGRLHRMEAGFPEYPLLLQILHP